MTATPPVATSWRSRIVGTGEEAPDALIANERNWRTHPKAQRAALAGVLDEVGYVATVLVNRRTGRLVDGHLRVDLARARGEAAIPVTYVDLSPEEEALVLASLDPLSAMASTDEAKLRELLAEVSVVTVDLLLTDPPYNVKVEPCRRSPRRCSPSSKWRDTGR